MAIQFRSTNVRIALVLIVAALGVTLFVTGVWAGSVRGDSGARPLTIQSPGSFWKYDPQTGNPTGPQGQLDFWNYDPKTGETISNYSPGVAPEALAMLWSGRA